MMQMIISYLVWKMQRNLQTAKIIMDDCNVDKAIQEQVCDAINNIGYSKRLKGHSPTTLEGKIVSDVDMCDALEQMVF